jgi:predicted TIM-barrel fold metal-dependent hydrolase
MLQDDLLSRRQALRHAAACGLALTALAAAAPSTTTQSSDPIIDIHQHTRYHKRTDEALLHHQQRMGVTHTVLLPGGRPVKRESTLDGRANGLEAKAGDYTTCLPIVQAHPGAYFFGANDVPDLPDSRQQIEKQIKEGAVCIGEQKFNMPVESPEMEIIYALAQEHGVPVLMHFQFQTYNTGYERFGDVLKKWPKVNFIAHAQTFWANIDAKHPDQKVLYPKGKVTPGGMSDRYLGDYPNFYGDMSAGSGLNALIRDEDHARGFIDRHQDKLLYGSDCPDNLGSGPTCTGASMISAIRRLSPSKRVARKLLFDNAERLFKLR